MRRFGSLICLFVACFVPPLQPAVAAPVNFCDNYARLAVSPDVQAAAKACSFTGPAWGANQDAHRRWCLAHSEDDALREQNARTDWTNRCLACTKYAGDAVNAQNRNIALKCGLTGDPWSGNFNDHRSWCMRNDQEASNLSQKLAPTYETDRRNAAIKQCEAKAETCKTYAKLAGDAVRENFQFGCKLPGPRFGTGDHYGWCMGHDAAAAENEQNARSNALAICRKEFTETEIQGCKNYATTAVNQWKRSKIVASGCKFGGPRWHANWDAHFAWCIGNFRGFEGTHHGALLMTSENAARNAEMKGCVGRSVNRDQRFPTTRSSQSKTLSSENDAAKNSSQRGVLEGGGLLDTNQGLVRQGPSPTGSQGGGAGGSAPPARGGGASGLR